METVASVHMTELGNTCFNAYFDFTPYDEDGILIMKQAILP